MKIGDKVKLLISSCGYNKGDIGTIIRTNDGSTPGFVVFVPGRMSTSWHKPNVAFTTNRLELIRGKSTNESWKDYYKRK